MLLNQGVHAIHIIRRDTHSCGATQMTFGILVGIRIIAQFGDVFIGHEAYQFAVLVYHRQFLYLMRLERIHDGLVVRGADGNKLLARHHLTHGLVHIRLKPQVAVRHNTHQHMLLVHHRDTADMILMHHLECIAYRLVTEDGYRVGNHAVLCTFDAANLCRLLCD